MKYLNITHNPSFHHLLDFDIDDINIDLHNSFSCTKIDFNVGKKEMTIDFKKDDTTNYIEQFAKIIFFEVKEFESIYDILDTTKSITIDNFGKGKIHKIHKYFETNINYFYIGFYEDQKIDVFCKEAFIILW